MQILRSRKRVEEADHALVFNSKTDPSWGYAFKCDENGNVDFDSLTTTARSNLDNAYRSGEFETPVVETRRNSYTDPAVGLCDCGRHVVLTGFTNTCDNCQADYNMSGQRLAPRSQWGEETGESLADILGID